MRSQSYRWKGLRLGRFREVNRDFLFLDESRGSSILQLQLLLLEFLKTQQILNIFSENHTTSEIEKISHREESLYCRALG